MRNTKWATGILAGALVLGSTLAYADSTEVGKWGVALNGGFNTHAMTDVNSEDTGNAGGVAGYTDITSGEQAGVEVKYRLADTWGLGAEANYLIVDNSQTLTYQGQAAGSNDENLGATEVLVNGSYIFPAIATGLDLRIGLGLGYAMLTGANNKYSPSALAEQYGQTASTTDLSGGGFDAKVFVGADYYFMPALSLGLNVGYRYAALSPITLSDAETGTWKNSSGSDQSVDYSGLNTQLALTWWIQ